jgi:hypothetical protein
MYATDIRFSQFEERLFKETREAGFAATLATLGLTTAAAFASGGTSQILSGAAAAVIGAREAFQKEVLAERTLIAIHTAMRAGRAQVRLRLLSGLRQSVEQYPVGVALSDLGDYYDAGTILGALVGITEVVGAEAREAETRLINLPAIPKEHFTDEAEAARTALYAAIASLPDPEAIRLVADPPTGPTPAMNDVAAGIAPAAVLQRNGNAARKVLTVWVRDVVPVADYGTWATALGVPSR